MNLKNPRHSTFDPTAAKPQVCEFSLSLPPPRTPSLCGLGRAVVCPPGPVSNKPCFFKVPRWRLLGESCNHNKKHGGPVGPQHWLRAGRRRWGLPQQLGARCGPQGTEPIASMARDGLRLTQDSSLERAFICSEEFNP